MKKAVQALSLAMSLIFVFVIAVADEVRAINFRNFDWYAPYSEVDMQMRHISESIMVGPITNTAIASYGWGWIIAGDDVENGGLVREYGNVSVAGYEADLIELMFMYKIDPNGKILRDTDSAEFYSAMYSFLDLRDKKAAYFDLKDKLTTLYGASEECNEDELRGAERGVKWVDEQGNAVLLFPLDTYYEEYESIHLVYMASGCDSRLSDLREKVTAEKIEAERNTRDAGINNVDGL